MVGLSPSCAKLHIALLDMSDVSGPVLKEVLGAQDILEFLAEATMEGSPSGGIVPLQVGDKTLKLSVIANEVAVSLSQLREGMFRSVSMVRVAIGLFKRGNEGVKVIQVDVVVVYQVDDLFEGSSFQPGEGIT
jgi:hypothetical protein